MFSSTFAFLGMQTELPVTLFILCFFLMKSHACIRHRHAMHARVFFFFCLMGKLRWDSLCLMFSLLLKKEHDFQENENIALRFLDKKE